MQIRSISMAGAVVALAMAMGSAAQAVSLVAVEDRWMYPFAGAGGTSNRAPTFGANSYPTFDNRDAQFLVEWDTSGAFTPGLGASSYVIVSARVEIAVNDGSFLYDPTVDAFGSYFGGTDTDSGRPVELFGVGYRNGNSTNGSNLETLSFGPGGPAAGIRNAFASDHLGGADRDVSNNVQFGFDPVAFAIGQSSLTPGDPVPAGTVFGFDLALTADVVAYLQARLDGGRLDLAVATLHESAFGGPSTYPAWATRENTSFQKPTLILDVTLVPEPGTLSLVFAGMAGLAIVGRRRG